MMEVVFPQGGRSIRACCRLRTRADHEFKFTDDGAPVCALVFANRFEAIGLGHQPNNLTFKDTEVGNSSMRNPILAYFSAKLLDHYRVGSCLLRALQVWLQIELIGGRVVSVFKVIFVQPRERVE